MYFSLYSLGFSQGKQLRVGDQYDFTDSIKVMNSAQPKESLVQYEDRLIILDFFTTSCGSCIEVMPKYNKLQKKFGSRIQILPVTVEKQDRVTNFFMINELIKDNNLPIVYEDEILKQRFPYKGVPHIVWIHKGVVKAITTSDMVNEQNIETKLIGQDVSNWPRKDDFFDIATVIDKKEIENIKSISSSLSSYINGAKLSYSTDTISSEFIRERMINVPIVIAYIYAFSHVNQLPLMKKERIVVDVFNRDKYVKPDHISKTIWEQKNSICYSSVLPTNLTKAERMKSIIADLNNKLGLNARLEMRTVSVYLVSKMKKNKRKIEIDEGQKLNIKIGLLEIMNPDFPPIVLEGVDENMLVDINNIDNFDILREEFVRNGLRFSVSSRKTLTLVLSDK